MDLRVHKGLEGLRPLLRPASPSWTNRNGEGAPWRPPDGSLVSSLGRGWSGSSAGLRRAELGVCSVNG